MSNGGRRHLHFGGDEFSKFVVRSTGSSLVDQSEHSLEFWKNQAKKMGQLLAESLHREVRLRKLQESGTQRAVPVPMEALRDNLHPLYNFLHLPWGKHPLL